MSKANAQKFIKLMEEDEKLKAQVEKIVGKHSKKNLTREAAEKLINEEIMPIAKQKGLEFTYAELLNSNGKLSDDELDKVVGGVTDGNGNWMTMCYYCCNLWTPAIPDADVKLCSSCKHWTFESASSTGEFSHGITVPMMFFKAGTCHAKH
jgi:hypothetical protein